MAVIDSLQEMWAEEDRKKEGGADVVPLPTAAPAVQPPEAPPAQQIEGAVTDPGLKGLQKIWAENDRAIEAAGVIQAKTLTPETVAKSDVLAEKSGLPAELVDRQQAIVEQQQLERDLIDALRYNKGLRNHMIKATRNAAGISDDLMPLGQVEAAINAVIESPFVAARNVPTGVASSFASMSAGNAQALGDYREILGDQIYSGLEELFGKDLVEAFKGSQRERGAPSTAPFGLSLDNAQSIIEGSGILLDKLAKMIDPEDTGLAADVGKGVGSAVSFITLQMIGGGVTSLVGMFGAGYDQIQKDMEKEKADTTTGSAVAAKTLGGGATVVSEMLSLQGYMKWIPEKAQGRITAAIMGMGNEFTNEMAEKVMHNLIAMGFYDPDRELITMPEIKNEGTPAAIVGGILGFAFGKRGSKRDTDALDHEERMTAAQRAVAETKTFARSPDKMREILTDMEAGEVSMPASKLVELMQSGALTVEQIDSLNIPEDMDTALRNDLDVTVSRAALLTLDTADFGKIAEHVRTRPSEKTAFEAREALDRREQDIQDLISTFGLQKQQDPAARPIYDIVTQKVTEAFPDMAQAEVDSIAETWDARYNERAALMEGVTPEQLFLEDNVGFRRPGDPQATEQAAGGQRSAFEQADAVVGNFDQGMAARFDSAEAVSIDDALFDPEGSEASYWIDPKGVIRTASGEDRYSTHSKLVRQIAPETIREGDKGADGIADNFQQLTGAIRFVTESDAAGPRTLVLKMHDKQLSDAQRNTLRALASAIKDWRSDGEGKVYAERLSDDEVVQSEELTVDEAVADVKKARGGNAQVFYQSQIGRFGDPLPVTGTGKGGRVLLKDIARAFTDEHMQVEGEKLYPEDNAGDFDRVHQMAREELSAQLDRPNSGVGWYAGDIVDAIGMTTSIFETLKTNKADRDFYLFLAGIFSNGTNPTQAWSMAAGAFELYLEGDRTVPVDRAHPDGTPVKMSTFKNKKGVVETKPAAWGTRGAQNTQHLALFKHLVEREGGVQGAIDWMLSKHPRSELNDAMTGSGAYKKGRYTTKADLAGNDERGAMVLGPKLGNYTLGLLGIEATEEDTTVDLWYTRSYRRWTGRLLDGPIDTATGIVGQVDSKNDDAERKTIFRLTGLLSREFGISIGDTQAVLWFFEKRLWAEHGGSLDEGTNSEGARKLLEARGVDVGERGNGQGGGPTKTVLEQPPREYGQQDGVAGAGDGGGRAGARQASLRATEDALGGAPSIAGATGPLGDIHDIARRYARSAGRRTRRQGRYVEVDAAFATRVAEAYEAMPNDVRQPGVRRAYAALIRETLDQYQALIEGGYTFEFMDPSNDPYGGNPWNAMRDLHENKHMYVYPTSAGYGSDADFDAAQNPLLAQTDLTWDSPTGPAPVSANDVFRAVHDVFGHGMEGAGFRARGEENAWQAHANLFSDTALAALTTETRGQNSWLNYGPHGEANQTAKVGDTIFADQKVGLLPEWAWIENRDPGLALPVMPDGKVKLTHYSSVSDLRETDPSFYGTGISGEEAARKATYPGSWVDRTYFGVAVGRADGYTSEFPADTPSYQATVEAASLYDMNTDPDKLLDAALAQSITHEGADGNNLYDHRKANTLYEKAIKEAGYSGYYSRAPQGMVAALFEKVAVERAPAPLEQPRKVGKQAGVGPNGVYSVEEDTYGNVLNIITLMEGADKSTFLHESAHFWLFQLRKDLTDPRLTKEGRAQIEQQFNTAKRWFGKNYKEAWRDLQKMASAARSKAASNPEDAALQQRSDALERAISRANRGGGDIYMKDVAGSFMDGTIEEAGTLEVAFHEMWARGFEKYAGEGRAPTKALRMAFARFSKWMTGIYRMLDNLNVNLDDDIRGVFDRLLAGEQALDAEKQRLSYQIPPDIMEAATDAELADLGKLINEAQIEARSLMDMRLAEEVADERTDAFKNDKESWTAEERLNVRNRPLYMALNLMRTGTMPDGTKLENPLRISRAEFDAMYGTKMARLLPRGIFAAKGDASAITIPELASLAGFSTDAEMISQLSGKPMSEGDMVKSIVNGRLQEKYQTALDPAQVVEDAAMAMNNDSMMALMALQAKILRRIAARPLETAAQRQVEQQGAPDASVDRNAIEDAQRAAEGAPGPEEDVPGQLRILWAEAQRKANIPGRRAQAAAKKSVAALTRSIDRDTVKAAAKRFIATLKVSDATPDRYRAAADRGVGKIVKAIAARKYDEAASLMQERMMNLAIAAEASAFQQKVTRDVRRWRKMLNRSDKKLGKSYDMDIINSLRVALEPYGLADRQKSNFDAEQALSDLEQESPAAFADLSSIVQAMQANAVRVIQETKGDRPYRALTTEEFSQLINDAKTLLKNGRDYKSLLIDGERVAFDTISAEISDYGLNKRPQGPRLFRGEGTRTRGWTSRAATQMVGTIKAATARIELWARWFDDGEFEGPMQRYLTRPVMRALDNYREARAALMGDLINQIKPHKGRLTGTGRIAAPELGGFEFENKAQLVAALLHTGNDSNKRKLLLGGQRDIGTQETYIFATENKETGELDTSRWDTFTARMRKEGVLTKADYDLVQSIQDLFEQTKEAAQVAHRKMHGYRFAEVASNEFTNEFGTYRGGYVPAVTDKMMLDDGARRLDADALTTQQNGAMFPGAEDGFTKGRVDAYAAPLDLNLMMIPAHLDRVLKFSHLGPTVRSAARLVQSRGFQAAVGRVEPFMVSEAIVPWLHRVVKQSTTTTDYAYTFAKQWSFLNRSVGLQAMAFNIVNTAQQITGILPAMTRISARGVATILGSTTPSNRVDYVTSRSRYMGQRFSNSVDDQMRNIRNVLTDDTPLSKAQEYAARYGYLLQQVTQNYLDAPIWMQAEREAKENGVWHTIYERHLSTGQQYAADMADAAAYEYADQVIRDTQAPLNPEDISRVESGTAFYRLFIKFYSWANNQFNLHRTEYGIAANNLTGMEGFGRKAFVVMTVTYVPAVAAQLIADVAKGEFPDEAEELPEYALELFLLAPIKQFASYFPSGGAAITYISGQFTPEFYDDRLSISPVFSYVEGVGRGVSNVVGAVSDAITGEEVKVSKAVSGMMNTFSITTGIPSKWLERPTVYMLKVSEGTARPQSVVDYVQGFTTGRDGTRDK